MTSEISFYILKCKNDYFIRLGRSLVDTSRPLKSEWGTLRALWNVKNVPDIHFLLVNNERITQFEGNANIFNKYFASQCTTVNNNSVLPSTLNHLTDDKLSTFNLSSDVIFQLIKNLDPNKAHGHDKISVKIYLCLSYVPLQYANRLLYSSRTVLHLDIFLMFGKKVILFQSIKKGINN